VNILNCPCCGSKSFSSSQTWAMICRQQGVAKGTVTYTQYKPDHRFTCFSCEECGMNTGHHETRTIAAKVWNKRATTQGAN